MATQNRSFIYEIIIGVLIGAFVAGVDATIGWWVSWLIGPGRLPDTISKVIINAIIIVMLTGAFCGMLGALIKLLL